MGILNAVGGAAVHTAIRAATSPPRQPPPPPRHPGTVVIRGGNGMAGTTGPRPWIDGSALLGNVRKYITRYLYLDSDAKATALTLWVAGSHFRDETGSLVHDTFPIAGFLSTEPGSGKTHALEMLSILCPAAPSILTEPSEAAIARLIGKHHRTILLDEGDILFGTGRRKAAIRAILNSGYKKGGTWPRASKGDVEDVPTYGAKAIAALSIAKTGTGASLDALFTRMVEFEMSKPPPGTVLHKLREVFDVTGDDGHPRKITGRDIGEHLATQLENWAAQEREALAAMFPEVPEGVELREEEKWLPLLAVAARAHANWLARGEPEEERTGEDWQQLARDACTDLSLYGGTPDTAPQQAGAIDAIMNGWGAASTPEPPASEYAAYGPSEPEEAPPAAEPPGEGFEDLIASVTAPPPPEPATPTETPFKAFSAVKVGPGHTPEVRRIGQTWDGRNAAMLACEDAQATAAKDSGTEWEGFAWQPSQRAANMWGATIRPAGQQWPEVSYAVTAAG